MKYYFLLIAIFSYTNATPLSRLPLFDTTHYKPIYPKDKIADGNNNVAINIHMNGKNQRRNSPTIAEMLGEGANSVVININLGDGKQEESSESSEIIGHIVDDKYEDDEEYDEETGLPVTLPPFIPENPEDQRNSFTTRAPVAVVRDTVEPLILDESWPIYM